MRHQVRFLILVSLIGWANAVQAEVSRVAAFKDTIGVNTHFIYLDGGYAQWKKVLAAIDYLGITNVRDAAPKATAPAQWVIGRAAKVGIRFSFVLGGKRPPQDAVQDLVAFEAKHPNAIACVEGPNEVNNWPLSFEGIADVKGKSYAGTIAYMSALSRVFKASPLKHIPLLAPSSIGPTKIVEPGDVDAGNVHAYPLGAESMLAKIAPMVGRQGKMVGNGKPVYFTEIGYNDLKTDPVTKARQTLNLLVGSAAIGVPRTYLYELLDAYPDPTNKSYERHWGLFDQHFAPKPVAQAIHNLTSILGNDTGGGPPPLAVKAQGPPGVQSLALGRSDGRTFVLLWRDGATGPVDVAVSFGASRKFQWYTPIATTRPIKAGTSDRTLIPVGIDLVVVEVWR